MIHETDDDLVCFCMEPLCNGHLRINFIFRRREGPLYRDVFFYHTVFGDENICPLF